jgi:protein-tyrosine-phosphatase
MNASVLFVCDDNAILGPMAEAFVKRHGWAAFTAYSAGIQAKQVHHFTYRVMEEIGYDLYGFAARSIFDFNHLQHVDFLITLSEVVNSHYVFNENHIGARLHWSFRNPLLEPAQKACIPEDDAGLLFRPYMPDAGYWVASSEARLVIQQKHKLRLQTSMDKTQAAVEHSHADLQDILKRFRRTRDEMEVQVMNWLEEQGIGPLWWRR